MRVFVFLALILLLAAPAAAQSERDTYVGGSLLGEFGRFGGVDIDDDIIGIPTAFPSSANTTTIGFSINAGRAISDRWGVEFAFARGGTSEKELRQRAIPTLIDVLPGLLPIPEFEIETAQQHTTFDATVWLRNELSERIDLLFLGGASFNRVEREQAISVGDPVFRALLPIPRESETVSYGVGPVVGAEAVIDIADHVAMTGGVRIHGINVGGLGGWLIRPAVGLRWSF